MNDENEIITKRTLKVYYGNYCNRIHMRDVYKRYPVIRLGGIYLSELDFQIGDSIEVKVKLGEIVIRKMPFDKRE